MINTYFCLLFQLNSFKIHEAKYPESGPATHTEYTHVLHTMNLWKRILPSSGLTVRILSNVLITYWIASICEINLKVKSAIKNNTFASNRRIFWNEHYKDLYCLDSMTCTTQLYQIHKPSRTWQIRNNTNYYMNMKRDIIQLIQKGKCKCGPFGGFTSS